MTCYIIILALSTLLIFSVIHCVVVSWLIKEKENQLRFYERQYGWSNLHDGEQ